jgi:hypothetical protein
MRVITPLPLLRTLTVAISIAALVAACADEANTDDVTSSRSALNSVNVITRNYNNSRTGANLIEGALDTTRVSSSYFRKLFQINLQNQVFGGTSYVSEVYAGLLYASAVPIAGGVHNVLYVATVNNTVYAFDADIGIPLWGPINFNNGFRPPNHANVGGRCGTYNDFDGNMGIVGTPVIDASTLTMYLVSRTVETSGYVQRLRAIDITTGAERMAAATIGTINPMTNNQRAALALSQGKVYVAWASHCDTTPYTGRVLAFSTSNLAQVAAFNAAPTVGMSGIWHGGGGPIVDGAGNLFYATGNSDTLPTATDYPMSILKLDPMLNRLGSFRPSRLLNTSDDDLASSGPIVVPGTNLLVMGGKGGGFCYLLNMNTMAEVQPNWQCVDPNNVRSGQSHHLHNAMVAWQSPAGLNLYTWGENDFGRAWRFNGTTFNTPAVSVSNVLPPLGMPGGMMTLSAAASATGTAVLWVSMPLSGDANQNTVPGVVRAFNAEDLTQELWNSSRASGDNPGNFSKGSIPIVANGMVYLASISGIVSAYGVGPESLAWLVPGTLPLL